MPISFAFANSPAIIGVHRTTLKRTKNVVRLLSEKEADMPIGRKRFTARTVETLKPAAPKPGATGRRFVMDAEVTGLGVKVTETGSRSYVLIKRFPALSTRRHGSWGPAMS